MGLFWCKKRQLTPSSDVYAAMFYEFISSLFPVFSSDTTLHNTRRFARLASGTVSQFSLPLRKNSAGKWNWNAVSTNKNGF